MEEINNEGDRGFVRCHSSTRPPAPCSGLPVCVGFLPALLPVPLLLPLPSFLRALYSSKLSLTLPCPYLQGPSEPARTSSLLLLAREHRHSQNGETGTRRVLFFQWRLLTLCKMWGKRKKMVMKIILLPCKNVLQKISFLLLSQPP